MIIRPAKKGDKNAIISIVGVYPKQLLQKSLPKMANFFVAEADGRIVGCAALEIYSRKIAEIRSLAVVKKYQGRGIGTKLVEACVKRAQKRRIWEIFAITASIRLFGRKGFSTFHNQKFALFKYLRPAG